MKLNLVGAFAPGKFANATNQGPSHPQSPVIKHLQAYHLQDQARSKCRTRI